MATSAPSPRVSQAWALAALAALGVGCGGDDASPTGATTSSTSAAGASGGGGTGAAGAAGGAGGAAPGVGGGGGALPIDAPPDEWAWRPIEGTRCANGSPAGVAVNLHEGSSDYFIVVSGGGACWNDTMCNVDNASVHLHEDLTEALITPELPGVDRSDPNNPLSTASWVYVPYCTGDIHWGDRTATYASGAIEHRGASNMRAFLERLRATRPASQRVLLFGGSAGGYGVTLHIGTAKEVFGDVEVHALADASPLIMPQGDRWATMQAEWAPALPPGCDGCQGDPGFILDALATAHPDSRHGLLTYDDDAVISSYFGYAGDLPAAVDALRTTHHDPFPNTRYFIGPGTDHGVLGDAVTAPDGTTPTSFMLGWLVGDPAWHSVAF
jgi:hypothetical protein